MNKLKQTMVLALTLSIFSLSSCKKDAFETAPGTWTTSDGGTITLNADGTGATMDSPFFEFDCGTLNGNRIGPIPSFTWEIVNNGTNDNLLMNFSDSTSFTTPCSGSMEFPVKFTSKNKGTVGANTLGLTEQIELTRQ